MNERNRTCIPLLAALMLFAGAVHPQEQKANPMVKLTTTLGAIDVELYPDKAPQSVENFLQYVSDGFYNGVIFHRVIPGFMIQGGGFEPGMNQKSVRSSIQNEADNGLKNERGTLAMARTNEPHSATAQFFINLKDNDFLNHTGKNPRGWGYAVFGKVVSGMDVVDRIAQVPTGTHGYHRDVPNDDVVINSAEVME